MKLAVLAQRTADSFGLEHQQNLSALRRYIRGTANVSLTAEIAKIEDATLLRTLWEAGLDNELQDIVLKRLEKIK